MARLNCARNLVVDTQFDLDHCAAQRIMLVMKRTWRLQPLGGNRYGVHHFGPHAAGTVRFDSADGEEQQFGIFEPTITTSRELPDAPMDVELQSGTTYTLSWHDMEGKPDERSSVTFEIPADGLAEPLTLHFE